MATSGRATRKMKNESYNIGALDGVRSNSDTTHTLRSGPDCISIQLV